MQYTHDCLRQGPNLDNVSFQFEFLQTQFPNNQDHGLGLENSLEPQVQYQELYRYKELILVVNYRRIFHLALKVNKSDRSVTIVDYAK